MKRPNTLLSFCSSILVATAVIYGCGDDDDTVTPPKADSGTSSSGDTGASSSGDTGASSSGDTGTTKPPAPALGTQVDRFGRPAINTAANNTFNPDDTAKGTAKDGYNADNVAGGWVAKYKGEAAKNLAIYDSLDTNCGNQAFADNDAGPNRYQTLASVLTDDRQWLNTASTTCTTYLAVELNATGASPNTDCGGRKLTYDVIDGTYIAVSGASIATDGIAAVPAKVNGAAFPYLAGPP